MDMLMSQEIADARLTDWRKLAQGLHARYLVDGFAAGARFLAAVADLGEGVDGHVTARLGDGYVDLELVSADAVYRQDDGTEHVVEWVTQGDVDLAVHITRLAADLGLRADPAAVGELELGLDVTSPATVAPVWAALLTGDAASQGRGSPGDEVRDATARVPNLWFDDDDGGPGDGPDGADGAAGGQRFHVEVYVAPEVAEQRVAAAVAAGGTVVDDSEAPSLVVIADPEGNRGVLCVAQPPPTGG